MNKTWLIYRHEFSHAVLRAGYIVMTLIVPVGALCAIGIVTLLLGQSDVPVAVAAGASDVSNLADAIVPAIFSLLLAFALMFGATSLVKGLGEERESRLIEVLLSSVSARQLLVGKVLALGSAGLLQVLVWLISTPFLINLAASSFGGFAAMIQVPVNFLILGVVYFVLGYLLFATFSIGLGSITSGANEGGQLSLVYTLASFIPLWLVALLLFFPESPLWIILTLFPVTAPVQVMLRMGVSTIPAWQIVSSIGLLVAAIVIGMALAIRVFRMRMLMAGEQPKISRIGNGRKVE